MSCRFDTRRSGRCSTPSNSRRSTRRDSRRRCRTAKTTTCSTANAVGQAVPGRAPCLGAARVRSWRIKKSDNSGSSPAIPGDRHQVLRQRRPHQVVVLKQRRKANEERDRDLVELINHKGCGAPTQRPSGHPGRSWWPTWTYGLSMISVAADVRGPDGWIFHRPTPV